MFALRLPDINDTIELQIQSGKNVSDLATVNVYDQLEIKGYEVTLVPPAYTKQKPTTDFGPAGDITALTGTVVKFRALANTALAKGELVFDDGTKVSLNGEKGKDNAAGGEFTVTSDAPWLHGPSDQCRRPEGRSEQFVQRPRLEGRAADGRRTAVGHGRAPAAAFWGESLRTTWVSTASTSLRVLPPIPGDKTSISVKTTVKVPVTAKVECVVVAQLQPALHPGDTLFYHFEVRDLKGQPAISDIYVSIRLLAAARFRQTTATTMRRMSRRSI